MDKIKCPNCNSESIIEFLNRNKRECQMCGHIWKYEVIHKEKSSFPNLSIEQESSTSQYSLTSAVIGFYLGCKNIKLGDEGLIMHYNFINEITEAFIKRFPLDYDWSMHQGECWDLEIELFTDSYILNKEIITSKII